MLECARIVSTGEQIVCPWPAASVIPPGQRLALLYGVNVLVVAASVWLELWFFSDVGPALHTPWWWFVLGQAAALGFTLTAGVPDRVAAVGQAIMAGLSIGYTYFLVGTTMVDPRLAQERVELVFQAVELGCVCAAGMSLAAAVRFVARWQLAIGELASEERTPRQYTVADLLFLTAVIGVGLGLFNLFLAEEARETQIWRAGATVALAVPASLPWLWGVSQRRLSGGVALCIPLISVGLLLFLALTEYALTCEDFAAILEHAGQQTVALTSAATLNGLAVRGLGFTWRRV